MIDINSTTHPAYGMARFSRVSGHSGHLFGSAVECEHYIELEIMHAEEVIHDHHFKHYHGTEPIIRVKFSPAQFAELISSMNYCDGSPCTIKYMDGKYVESIPDDFHVHELDRQKKAYRERMKGLEANLKSGRTRVDELLAKPKLTKDEKKELRDILDRSITEVHDNIPFFMSEYAEATESVVAEAKAEIDATIQHAVVKTGLKALGMEFSNDPEALLKDAADEQ